MVGKSNKFSVEGASWLEQVFEMIATRNPNDLANVAVTVPDTVIFRYTRPAALYTNEDGVLRASDQSQSLELSAEALVARFARQGKKDRAEEDVCCSYIYIDRQTEDAGTQNVVMEDMNAKQLSHFLLGRTKENNGILQRFTKSKSAKHSMIRVVWTPRTFQVETRTNQSRMDDTRVSMEDRVATFGGGPHLSQLLDLKDGMLARSIREQVEAIVKHLEALLPKTFKVWETVMYLKYCGGELGGEHGYSRAGLTFLFCSSMRVFKDEVLNLNHLEDFWASEQRTERMVSVQAPQPEATGLRCPISAKPCTVNRQVPLQVVALVKYMRVIALEHLPGEDACHVVERERER
ncbi:hypothetical protein T484DRAFT_1759714 [Baffinella frigidus]|nr:hypothetical protein T484DRAFT_1759714 [Cryptophyta sp. CCMP2293]